MPCLSAISLGSCTGVQLSRLTSDFHFCEDRQAVEMRQCNRVFGEP
jgi:hypothetical protein